MMKESNSNVQERSANSQNEGSSTNSHDIMSTLTLHDRIVTGKSSGNNADKNLGLAPKSEFHAPCNCYEMCYTYSDIKEVISIIDDALAINAGQIYDFT